MNLLDKLLPDSYYLNPAQLGFSRIVFCLTIIIFTDLPAFSWIGQEDLSYFFAPPAISLARLFHDFPGALFFRVLTLLNLVFFFLMFLGIWGRWTSLLFSLTGILGHNFWYSFGKVDHSLLWIITPLFLGFAGWGDYFSIQNLFNKTINNSEKTSPEQNSFWISMLAISIGFAMFSSGVAKVKGGWLNWQAEAVHFHLIRNYFALNKTDLLATYFLKINNHLLWKAMDYSALLLELGFLVSVARRKWFSFFVAAAVLFHFIVALMFNIFFSANLLAYIVFINWQPMDASIGISRIATSPVRYYKAIRNLLIFSLSVLTYWLYCFFTYKNEVRFPSLLQTSLDLAGLTNSRDITLNCFFLGSILVLIYAGIHFIRGYFHRLKSSV